MQVLCNIMQVCKHDATFGFQCNQRTAEDRASDDMGRAAARSDQKINTQLLQVSARYIASTQKADTLSIHCKTVYSEL